MGLTKKDLQELDMEYLYSALKDAQIEIDWDSFKIASCAVAFTKKDCNKLCRVQCGKTKEYPMTGYEYKVLVDG